MFYALHSESVLPINDVNEFYVTRNARIVGVAFRFTGEGKEKRKYKRTCAGELHLRIFQIRHEFFYSSYARASERINLLSISPKCIELSLEMQSINKSFHAGYDYGSWVRDFPQCTPLTGIKLRSSCIGLRLYEPSTRLLRNTLQERIIASKSIALPTLDSERDNMLRRSAETV